MRQKRKDYLENQWKPAFLKNWIKNGRLIEVAKGDIVWSFDKSKFVSPDPEKANIELLNTIEEWSSQAIRKITEKEEHLIAPLNKQEKDLREEIRQAFERVLNANAIITAHLNSLREVKEVQDEALQALKLKDLRDKINNQLDELSQNALEGLEKVKKADGLVDNVIKYKGE